MSKEQGSESAVSGSQFMKEEEMEEEKEAPRKLSRRQFVKGAAVGGAGVAAAGVLASCAPPATPAPGETAAPAPTCPPAGECPPAATPWIPEKWDYEADVVVVGYGGAGVCAAIAATDAGAKVLVLEKDSAPNGGNTGCAGGSIHHSIWANDVEAYVRLIHGNCYDTMDEETIRGIVLHMQETKPWLESLGLPLVWKPDSNRWNPELQKFWSPGQTANLALPDGSAGTGEDLFAALHSVATDRGIEPMLATPATELVQDGVTKEILGVMALEGVTLTKDGQHTGGKEIYVKAKKGVIFACGGYENNAWMRRTFSTHALAATVTQYGTPCNTGDGIVMAQAVGAKLYKMNKRENHAWACAAASAEIGTGVCVMAYGDKIEGYWGIVVNRDGNRFMSEWFDSGHKDQHRPYDEFDDSRLPDDDYDYFDYRNVPMYWVFDDTTMKAGSLRGTYEQWVGIHKLIHPDKDVREQWSEDNEEELAKGWFIKADTIEELGEKLVVKNFEGHVVGMDAAGLVETVNKYNQYCAAGKDEDFGRRPSTLIPVSTPPFYAMEVIECQTNTGGGPQRNADTQTLNAFGKVIPRLYNTGELGVANTHSYDFGNIADALTTGMVAGKHAAALEPWG